VTDFSLRLAAYYDASSLDYPIAVSNVVYVLMEAATPTPTVTATPTEMFTPTPTETVPVEPMPDGTPTATLEPGNTPVEPTPEAPTPTGEPANALRAAITYPEPGAQVSGEVQIVGSADGDEFVTYLVEYAPGDQPGDGDWQPVSLPVLQAVTDGLLAVWDSSQVPTGI
jgi:hypothetical protein